jgi:ESS family glutamate:Na+ symporter
MNGLILTELLYCFCVLSALLLIGTFLRSFVPVFQKLFLPASVIGGFVGLLAGPIIWKNGGIPFPQSWITTWSSLPGILIVPVIAATPLGMRFGRKSGVSGTSAAAAAAGAAGIAGTSSNVIKMFALLFVAGGVQIVLGLSVREVFVHLMPQLDLYKTFGYELVEGFGGGHGTAGFIGGYFRDLKLPYWEIAQGLTTTTATFGLVGGMIIGIIAINVAARNNKTALLKKPGELPKEIARGYETNPEKQKILGRETFFSSSIESLSFHLAIILSGCGIAYIIMNLVKKNNVPVINQLPIWVYAVFVMYGVNFIVQKTGLKQLIDVKVKSRITGVCSDYAITAAIASMPVHTVMLYVLPLMTLMALGFIFTYITVFGLCKKVFRDCWFERGLCVWGTYTGVFFTGLMLLKICDSDYELPALNDYTVGFSMTTLLGFIITPLTVGVMLQFGYGINMLVQGGITVIFLVVLFGADYIERRRVLGTAEKS